MARTLRRYWKTAAMAAAAHVGDSPLFVVDYVLRLLRVLLLLSIWRLILEGRAATPEMAVGAILTYTLVAEVFHDQLTVRSGLADAFWEGTIVTKVSQPVGFVGLFAAEMVGRWLFGLAAFSLPLFALAPLLGVDPGPADAAAGALFVASLVLGVVVGLALDFLFGAITLWTEQPVWLVEYVRWRVSPLLSGALLPLAVLPWGLGDLFAWLPFAATAWAPLAIYTGVGAPLPLLMLQLGWAIVLWPCALWFWRANRERVVGYGG